jgi:ABC-type cobalamin/Fe3+-siderophores transport system ATPase subunit
VSRQAILDAVAAERAAGRTVVLTTHDLGEAGFGDHLLLLAGRVVAGGDPADVLTARHLAEAYGARFLHLDGDTVLLDDAPHHHHGHADAEGAERPW